MLASMLATCATSEGDDVTSRDVRDNIFDTKAIDQSLRLRTGCHCSSTTSSAFACRVRSRHPTLAARMLATTRSRIRRRPCQEWRTWIRPAYWLLLHVSTPTGGPFGRGTCAGAEP